MKPGNKIFLLTIIIGISFGIVDSILDAFVFYDRSFLSMMIFDVPPHEIFMRALLLAIMIVFGLIFKKIINDKDDYSTKLKTSELRYKQLNEVTFEGIVIHKNGIYIDSNQSFRNMYGYDETELQNKSLIEILFAPDQQNLIKDKMRNPSNSAYESIGVRKNGERFPVEIEARNTLYKDEVARVAAIRDISEKKNTQLELAAENSLLNTLMNNIPENVYFKNLESKFIRVSDSTIKKLGFEDTNALIGKSDFDIFAKEHAQTAFDDEQKIIQTGEALIDKEEKEIWPDGKITWASTSKLPFYDLDGNIQGTFGITRDITKSKLDEEEVRRAKDWAEKISQVVPSAVFTVDCDEVVLSWNKMAEKITGYTSKEIIGQKCSIFALEPCIDGCGLFNTNIPKPIMGKICTIRNKAGEKRIISKSVDLLWDSEDNIVGGIESFNDITDLKAAEDEIIRINEELKLSNNSKDKFFSIIAHDLRSPFTALLGYSDMMMEDIDDMSKDEIMEFTSGINSVAKNVYGLLENLLSWSRLQTGRIEFYPEIINLSLLADTVLTLFTDNAKSKRINLNRVIGDNLLVYADNNMLNTILRNLLSNAIKFTPEGGVISLVGKEEDRFIQVCVKDTGVGMSENDMNKLFKVDIHHTTIGTGAEKGTGLGLILCKELVEKNGGKIWVESELGKGTSFIITLPKSP